MTDKKLYWRLYDPIADATITTLPSDVEGYLSGLDYSAEDWGEDEITLTPIWLTDEEYEKLPEYDG
jgi:hypothetical protein